MEMCFSMPAVMGMQGGKVFYTVMMSMRVLVRMLRIDDAGSVLERSQRNVNHARANAIAKYISSNPKGYVLPGIIGVVEVPNGSDAPKFEASEISSCVGVLKVSMDSIIKLFDGQHRAVGISKALERCEHITQDTISITVYPSLSLQERQQAFTDINQNASKPAQGLGDTYNHRDPLSQITMQVIEETEWLFDRVDFANNKASTQSNYLWSFKQLKDATAIALGTKKPTESEHAWRAKEFWCDLGQGMQFLSIAASERDKTLFTTTVMLKALAKVRNEHDALGVRHWRTAFERLVWSRNSKHFIGRCICPTTGKMIANADAVNLTANQIMMAMDKQLPAELEELEHKYFPKEAA